MARLNNKTTIITGGSGGIGIAAGKLFAAEGAKVLLVDLDEQALQQAVADIGGKAVSYAVADVTQPEQVQQYVQTATDRYGGIDIFLNNAGIEGEVKSISEYSIETFDRVMAVNVRGVWLGLKYVMPEMKKRGGGSIVITSSVAGVKGTPKLSAYVASKHAVIGLMRSASLEGAAMNIRVNTVNPAPIDTRMIDSLDEQTTPGQREQVKQKRTQFLPLKRYGEPKEVADLMLFLASDESKYCSGGIYMVDGALTAG